jgi:hypothetical protein
MQITQFQINAARTQIDLTITDAATTDTLTLFTQDTFRDYTLGVDLSSKLTAGATQNIIITLADINESEFDGVYYIEAQDPDEIRFGITADLTRYKECILEDVVALALCDSCFKKESTRLTNAQHLLRALQDAVDTGFYREAFNLVGALNKFCSNECKTCGTYSNVSL